MTTQPVWKNNEIQFKRLLKNLSVGFFFTFCNSMTKPNLTEMYSVTITEYSFNWIYFCFFFVFATAEMWIVKDRGLVLIYSSRYLFRMSVFDIKRQSPLYLHFTDELLGSKCCNQFVILYGYQFLLLFQFLFFNDSRNKTVRRIWSWKFSTENDKMTFESQHLDFSEKNAQVCTDISIYSRSKFLLGLFQGILVVIDFARI